MTRVLSMVILILALLAAPLAAEAQPAGKVYRIGFLSAVGSFATGRSDRGISPRSARARLRRGAEHHHRVRYLPRAGSIGCPRWPLSLSDLKVDLIVAAGTPASLAGQAATDTIPIVMGTWPPIRS